MEKFQEAPLKGEVRELQNPDIIEAIGSAVRDFGIKDVAKRLRKSAGQLYAELSEFGDQRKAKLSLDDAIEATRITKNATWLEMAAAELGFSLVPDDCTPDKASVAEELADDVIDFGKFAEACAISNEKGIHITCAALIRNVLETEKLAIATHRKIRRRPR